MIATAKVFSWVRRHWLVSLFLALTTIFTIGIYASVPTAEAAPSPANIVAQASSPYGGRVGSDASSVSSCALDQIGWIACPIIRSVAIVADSAFTFITKDFLVVDIDFLSGSSTTNTVWGIMRNFANVLFVIFFLVIVYSLITGSGVNNYDLKRLVPRLLIAAILVNISFFICQLAIDLITVMGASILDLIKSVLGSGTITGMPLDRDREDMRVLGEIASQTLANTEVAWILLAPIIAVVFSSAVISSVILVILILRKVAIIALVLLAPIAFVAYLLPNTEQYFAKWMKLFIHLLLIFPIIALLLGTGQIVSAAIIKSEDSSQSQGYKQSGDEYTTTNGGGQASATLRLIAAGAAVLPLAGTWYAFKGMTALMDSAGGRIKTGRRRTETSSSKDSKRREAALNLNQKSQMMKGINKIQQLTAMQDGGSGLALLNRSGRRTYKKTTMKSDEQKRFDAQVQNRLQELRNTENISPQQNYIEALQRYQNRQTDIVSGVSSGGDSLNINSYEGIDLKASEAYLLESLGKGVTNNSSNNSFASANNNSSSNENNNAFATTNNAFASNKNDFASTNNAFASTNNSNTNNSTNNTSKSDNGNLANANTFAIISPTEESEKDKKAAGISSLEREGKSGGGDGSASNQDDYRAPSVNSQAAINSALESAGVASSAGSTTVVINTGSAPANDPSASQPRALSEIELKAKARAAKYTAQAQEALINLNDSDENGQVPSIAEALKAQAGVVQDIPPATTDSTNSDNGSADNGTGRNESV